MSADHSLYHLHSATSGERSPDELGENLQWNGNTSDRLDDSAREDGNQRHDDTVDHNHRRSVGGPETDPKHSEDRSNDQDNGVPPLGHLLVRFHQVEVNVFGEVGLCFRIVASAKYGPVDTLPEGLDSSSHLVTMVDADVRKGWD